jgi:hypothetical protein
VDFGTNAIIQLPKGQADFQLILARTQEYVLQRTTDLVNWSPVLTNSAIIESTASIHASAPAGSTDAFFRVIGPTGSQ